MSFFFCSKLNLGNKLMSQSKGHEGREIFPFSGHSIPFSSLRSLSDCVRSIHTYEGHLLVLILMN